MIAVVLLLATLPHAAAAGGRSSIEAANSRWRGAHCRSLQEIVLKGRPNREGVVPSRWLWWGEKHSNHRARMYFENADGLLRRFPGGVLPAGTDFTAVGWKVEGQKGPLSLELAVTGTPARARLYFWDDWVGKVGVKRIDDFEHWVRFDLLEILDTPDEALVAVDQRTGGAPPPPVAPPTPPPSQTPVSSEPMPGIRVLAVSVEPAQVAPGGEVQLVAVYQVEGVGTGAAVPVTERRTISQGGTELTTLENQAQRGSGVHRSSLPMRVPAELAAGVYELHLTVRASGTTAEGSAVFEVTHGPR